MSISTANGSSSSTLCSILLSHMYTCSRRASYAFRDCFLNLFEACLSPRISASSFHFSSSSRIVSVHGPLSVVSFLFTSPLPFLIISSNCGFIWSFLRTSSSIFWADSSASIWRSSLDSRISIVSRYQTSKFSTWEVNVCKVVEISLKNISLVWTVLTKISNFFWTSFTLVSIFFVSLTLLEFWMNCCADSYILWMLGSWEMTSDCKTFSCLICSSNLSLIKLAGFMIFSNALSVESNQAAMFARASWTPWQATKALSKSAHLSAIITLRAS